MSLSLVFQIFKPVILIFDNSFEIKKLSSLIKK